MKQRVGLKDKCERDRTQKHEKPDVSRHENGHK